MFVNIIISHAMPFRTLTLGEGIKNDLGRKNTLQANNDEMAIISIM